MHGLDDANGVERIGANHQEVRIGRLDRTDDRREIHRRRRIILVVDDPEPGGLGVGARTLAGIMAELGVGVSERDGLRLGILRFRDFEEAVGECGLGRRSVRHHGEIHRIVEFVVDRGAGQTDQQLLSLDRNRHRGGDLGRGIAGNDQVDFVDVEQLGVDAGHMRGIALIVVVNELDRAAEQAAAALVSSSQICIPRRAILPLAASLPVSDMPKPILIGRRPGRALPRI